MRLAVLPLIAVLAATALPAADRPAPTQGPAATATERPRLGVQIDEASLDDPSAGLPISGVSVGTTAAIMGMMVGDRIKSLNGTAVHSVAELQNIISALKLGDAITAAITRKGQAMTLTGTLQATSSAEALREQLNQARKDLDELRRKYGVVSGREPTLAEMIQQLKMLEEQFPRAAAEFKKVYPNGEFAIAITITSDKTAKNPVDLMTADPNAVLPKNVLPQDGEPAKGDGAPAPAPKK